MEKGQHFLIIKYSLDIEPECIEKHKEVIDKEGYCWFAKVGRCPSPYILNDVLSEETPKILLYAKGKVHLCDFETYTKDKPKKGMPEYYETELFRNMIYPDMYFKITSIEEMNINELSKYHVCSSGKSLSESMPRCMSSFILAEYPDPTKKRVRVIEKGVKRDKGRVLLDKNDCNYRKNGFCANKSCISYKYECERPSNCVKQKR